MSARPAILGRLLLDEGAVTADGLTSALEAQRGSGRRLGEILVGKGLVDGETVARVLAVQLGLAYLPPPLAAEPEARALVRPELARDRRVLPVAATARTLRLAMADPLDLRTVDDVRFQVGRRVEPAVASPSAIVRGLARAYGEELAHLVGELPAAGGAAARPPAQDGLEEASRSAPVVRLVDHVLDRAVEERASDIHIEERAGDVRVRFRVDGLLREVLELPPGARRAVLSRIKVMAGMDISIRRRPQDGAIPLEREGRRLTLRVSTLPVEDGEKGVVRILDPRETPPDLGAIGLLAEDLKRVRALLRGNQGVILAAGPTGSGKSSTLHSALHEIDRERLNVVTLEDPVEWRIPGVSQVQVRPRAGLTFPVALRAVLRQDPDVVMVGEIRDRETAEIAMAAAVTGHLVLSTIHTVDAPGAVTRLLNMGVPPFLVAGGLAGVVAQRLVRRVCAACGGRSATGCGRCQDGYRGRTGVFQVLVMTDALRDEVVRGASTGRLRRLAAEAGMTTLAEDARRKVAEGVTTPHEVARVLQSEPGAALPCPGCGSPCPPDAAGCPSCGRPRGRTCGCGTSLEAAWRYCPSCLRKA
jgi:type IV pilus assembly protein PilB